MHPLFDKVAAAVRELGPGTAVLYACDRALGRLGMGRVHRYVLVAQPAAEPRLAARRGGGIEIHRISSTDPRLLGLDGLTPEVLAHRARHHPVCFAAVSKGVVVGCLWLAFGAYEEDEVRCRFRPLPEGRVAWDFGVFLLPAYRAGRAFALLWDTANAYLRERGIDWSLSRISAFNAGSLSAHRRLGAVPLGTATFVSVGGWQLAVASRRPFVHLCRRASPPPEIVLAAPDRRAGNP